ncbi:MAG: hypothetical protein RL196_1525 [Actinomycetota bacterium]|jgi:hypothetical protein
MTSPWYELIKVQAPNARSIAVIALGALFNVRLVLPSTSFYFGDFAAFILILLSLSKPPRFSSANSFYASITGVLLIFLCLESYANGTDFSRRMLRLAILIVLAGFIASGRVDAVQLLGGIGLGLFVNFALYYLGLTPESGYVGCLTGFLADKNVAGFYYSVFTFAILAMVRSPWARFLVLTLGMAAVFLTFSRTSMVAMAFGIIWLLVGRRAGFFSKAVFATISYFAYIYLEKKVALVGIFADRSGSDALRSRIDAATAVVTRDVPWFGKGLGTAKVEVGEYSFFFHNSYLGLVMEGGWFFAFIVLFGLIAVTVRPFAKPPFSFSEVAIQAAGIALLLCATRLGEVFMALPTFVVLGCGMQILLSKKSENHLQNSA